MAYRNIQLGQIGHNEVVDFAVQELTRYLKRMDKKLVVDILQTDKLEESFENVIWVGLDEKLASKVPAVADAVMDDAIVISIENGTGYITGSNERSVLIAAYRFLRELGCRWVRPGVEGERIPQKCVENVTMDICEVPSYRHRGVCIEGANTCENILEMIDYLPKVGMNQYLMQFMLPVLFFERWYGHEGNPTLEKQRMSWSQILAMVVRAEREIARRGILYHKTGHGWTCEPLGIHCTSWHTTLTHIIPPGADAFFAEVNGKRELWQNVPMNTNLCYSNPAARKLMVDAVVEYCRRFPNIGIIDFVLADGGSNHCECAGCAQKRPSDWYVIILNELDAAMTAAGIPAKVIFAVYQDTMWAPETEKILNPDRFIIQYAPITRTYGHTFEEYLTCDEELPPYVRNKVKVPDDLALNLKQIRKWQEDFKGDGILFDYHLMWAFLNDFGHEACAKNLYDDMRGIHKINLDGMMSCQVTRCQFPTALPFWMMAATLWNENCKYNECAEDYYQAAFGEDWKAVREYLSCVSDLMQMYEGPWDGEESRRNGPFCRDYDALLARIDAFQPVIARNLEKQNDCWEDWELLRLHGEYMKEAVKTLIPVELCDMVTADVKIDDFITWMQTHELDLQKVLDVFNTRRFFIERLRLQKPGREWGTVDV